MFAFVRRRSRVVSWIRSATLLLVLLSTLSAAAPAPEPAPPGAPAVSFMGIKAEATRVAFVCDGSRWTDTKDEELFAELLRAIEPLVPDQHFAVIFFADDKAWGPEGGKPLAGTPENKKALREWLESVDLGRQSTPAAGLKLAFEGTPDCVFFTSDGNFERYDEVRTLVASLNRGRSVRVHTAGYFLSEEEDDSRSFVEFLKKLADDNGGQSKVAYADEMKRRH